MTIKTKDGKAHQIECLNVWQLQLLLLLQRTGALVGGLNATDREGREYVIALRDLDAMSTLAPTRKAG